MAEEEIIETTIIEERVEFMVDSATSEVIHNPTQRTGYFLKPSLNPNALPPKLPKIQSFSSSSKPNVVFLSHSTPLKGWETWVKKLEEIHEPDWRKAGIFDAIKGSIYHIRKIDNLIYRLVEKWCPETNTFVFPWGEATVTLEDVFVLGGFLPLGVSVSSNSSCLGDDVQQVENKLIETSRKLRNYHPNVSQLRWLEHFMGCGDEIEYAGFLALWLTRHVFPGRNLGAVPQSSFVTAARISCGAKLAFGPVILASIYRDLTLIKKEIVRSLSGQCARGSSLKVSSPLHLVQVWAWERFSSLGPVPRMIGCGEVRLARWESHSRKLLDDIDNIDMCLDSGGRENFRWRPYGISLKNLSLPRFYVKSGMWVVVDSDEEWKSFARCLMVGQLSGFDCVQDYNPHRVALQFGFDQDIPESRYTVDELELEYGMNFKGLKLYLPSRLHEGDVTSRYFGWWRTRVDVQEVALVGCKRKKAKTELSRGIDQEESGMELAEMLLERKQDCDANHAMGSLCAEVTSEHQNFGSEMEKRSEYLEANFLHIETSTECNGNEPDEALCQDPDTNHGNVSVNSHVAASLPVTDKSDQKSFAARCLEYESRMCRLETKILGSNST